jgi:hypothetical protein
MRKVRVAKERLYLEERKSIIKKEEVTGQLTEKSRKQYAAPILDHWGEGMPKPQPQGNPGSPRDRLAILVTVKSLHFP